MNGGIHVCEDRLYFGLQLVQGTVFEADFSGALLRMIEFGSGAGTSGVGGLAVDRGRRLYVADPTGQKLRLFSPEGLEVGSIGQDRAPFLETGLQYVDQPGILEDPNDVAVDEAGNLYVACGEQFHRHGVQKFSPSGEHLACFPSMGEPEGSFGGPRALVLDPDGTLLVCDTLHHRLQRFSLDGRFLEVLGPPRSEPLNAPVSVAVLPSGELLVVEGGGLFARDRQGARRNHLAPRRVEHATAVCASGEGIWVLERDFGEFGIRVSRLDLAGNVVDQPVPDVEDLVRRATEWLKARAPEAMAVSTAWHKVGALHHYVLPESSSAFRTALGCYQRALEADPDGFEVRLDLAELLVRRNRRAEARTLYLECLALRPEDESARLRLALLLRSSGEEGLARAILRAGLERRPESDLLREELGRLSGSVPGGRGS